MFRHRTWFQELNYAYGLNNALDDYAWWARADLPVLLSETPTAALVPAIMLSAAAQELLFRGFVLNELTFTLNSAVFEVGCSELGSIGPLGSPQHHHRCRATRFFVRRWDCDGSRSMSILLVEWTVEGRGPQQYFDGPFLNWNTEVAERLTNAQLLDLPSPPLVVTGLAALTISTLGTLPRLPFERVQALSTRYRSAILCVRGRLSPKAGGGGWGCNSFAPGCRGFQYGR